LENVFGHSLKLILKIWAPLRKLIASPGVPRWLRAWSEGGQELENFSKKRCFLSFEWQKKISPLLATPEKFLEKSTVDPWKKSFRRPCTHKHVKLQYLKNLCCITPFGNTVQQHQCGKQAIAG